MSVESSVLNVERSAPRGAVFLSYASQDVEAAKRICEALRAAGIEVWLDQSELVGGDAWDRKIREQIGSCALFVPVISANTQARKEGYFRLEWKLAAQRTHMMSERTAFLLPVVIDATRDADADVPGEFRAVQWTRIGSADSFAALGERVKKLLGALGVAEVANLRVKPTIARPATIKTPVRRRLAPVIISLAVLGVLALWQPWKKSAAPQPPLDLANAKSIAVLPFANLSDDKDNTAFFSDGMHEDILTTLANIPDLRVISRTSVMQYRDTKKPIPQIARELGVAYILEGSVRRAGNQIRLTGQLIRAAQDEHLWAKSYDRELTPKEMFAIQAALATEIAGALQAAISPAAKKLVERRPTENLAAYDLYLKARAIPFPSQRQAVSRGKLLQEAVDLDPDFATAWGELAVNHVAFVYFDWDHTPERLTQADIAMDHARRLAPDDPAVLTEHGMYLQLGYRDFAGAEALYLKALRLRPNSSDTFLALARAQRHLGRYVEALGNHRKAAELDRANLSPLRAPLFIGRRWEEALAVQKQIIAWKDESAERWNLACFVFAATGSTSELDERAARLTPAERDSPEFLPLQRFRAIARDDFKEWQRLDALPPDSRQTERDANDAAKSAMVLAAHGDLAAARTRLGSHPAQLQSRLKLQPDNARARGTLALMEALLGENESALRDARRAVERVPESRDAHEGPQHRFNLAKVLALTNDRSAAVAELARLLSNPYPSGNNFEAFSVHTLRVDPAFANLRGDPRFEALLKDPKNHAPLF